MAVILGWNPKSYPIPHDAYAALATAGAGRAEDERWSVGRHVNIHEDETAFLFRHGRDRRGIVAIGRVASDIYRERHWENPLETVNYVDVQWTAVAELDDRLDVETLLAEVPEVAWNSLYESGRPVDPSLLPRIESLWASRTLAITTVEAVPLEVGENLRFAVVGTDGGPRERREWSLCTAYSAYLRSTTGADPYRFKISISEEEGTLWTDLYDAHRHEVIEAKSSPDRRSLREAVGQLLDYRRLLVGAAGFPAGVPALAVLVPACPTADLAAYLRSVEVRCIVAEPDGTFRSLAVSAPG